MKMTFMGVTRKEPKHVHYLQMKKKNPDLFFQNFPTASNDRRVSEICLNAFPIVQGDKLSPRRSPPLSSLVTLNYNSRDICDGEPEKKKQN